MLKTAYRWIAPLAVVVLVTVVLASVAGACPTCKDGLDQNDPQHQSVARGFYYSILFMMSMPYIILGSFGYLAFLSIRRAKAQQEAGGEAGSQESGFGQTNESC